MPAHFVHFYVDRVFFGKIYYQVHRDLDSAYEYFRSKHRIFWHDPVSAYAIAENDYPGDRNAITSALLHIEIDNECSANPVFHEQLIMLAKADANKRKRAKKRKKKIKNKKERTTLTEVEKTEKTLKQLIELMELVRLIRS